MMEMENLIFSGYLGGFFGEIKIFLAPKQPQTSDLTSDLKSMAKATGQV